MHLSQVAIESAIKLLDQPVSDLVRGDIGETGPHRPRSNAPKVRGGRVNGSPRTRVSNVRHR